MLTVTESAAEKIKQLTGDESPALRIEVVRGPHGCVHGWNFGLDTDDSDGTTIYETEGVKIVTDSDSAPLIDNASVDYREDATAVGFTIDAPLAGHGGCGNH